jgi:hypothetical protein
LKRSISAFWIGLDPDPAFTSMRNRIRILALSVTLEEKFIFFFVFLFMFSLRSNMYWRWHTKKYFRKSRDQNQRKKRLFLAISWHPDPNPGKPNYSDPEHCFFCMSVKIICIF